jgi:hypothetical protein
MTGAWTRFSFPRSMLQRIFHVCLENTPAGKRVVKLPRGDNWYSVNLIKSVRGVGAFQDYRTTLTGIKKDRWLGEHAVEVLDVRKDGGYDSEYIEGFNLAHLRDVLFDPEAMPEHLRGRLANAINELLDHLRSYDTERGRLIGDWALHNLMFSPDKAAVLNVDAEGFFSFKSASVENDLALIEASLQDLLQFLGLLESRSPEDKRIVAVLRVLDEVRRSGKAYSGQDFLVGYHSLELRGRRFRGQRECAERLAQIPFDFKGKVVVDLGCNCGGMLHALSKDIKKGYGFDYNPKCIAAAEAIKVLNQTDNLEFFAFDLDRDDLATIPNFLGQDKVDICFLLSVCMWLKRWQEVVHHAASLAGTLLFESNGSIEQQDEQMALLRNYFAQIQLISASSSDDPMQTARKLYLCTGNRSFAIHEPHVTT